MDKLPLTYVLISNSKLLFSEREILRKRFLEGRLREEIAIQWETPIEQIERIEKGAIEKIHKMVDRLFAAESREEVERL